MVASAGVTLMNRSMLDNIRCRQLSGKLTRFLQISLRNWFAALNLLTLEMRSLPVAHAAVLEEKHMYQPHFDSKGAQVLIVSTCTCIHDLHKGIKVHYIIIACSHKPHTRESQLPMASVTSPSPCSKSRQSACSRLRVPP
jgi:hypothetical protein